MSASNSFSRWLFTVFVLSLAGLAAWMILVVPAPSGPASSRPAPSHSAPAPSGADRTQPASPGPLPSADAAPPGPAAPVSDVPDDPQAWFAAPAAGGALPPLNVAIDRTRGGGGGLADFEQMLLRNVLAGSGSTLRMKSCLLEVSGDELRNVNLLFVHAESDHGYSPEEKTVVREFMEYGGTCFLLYVADSPFLRDFLKGYGASVGKPTVDVRKTGLKFTLRDFLDEQVEATAADLNPIVCGKGTGWQALVVSRTDPETVAVATRRVGQGRLVVASGHCVLGHVPFRRTAPRNIAFLGRLFDACARTSRRVDPYSPFPATDLNQAPVRMTGSSGVRIAASQRHETGAQGVREFMERWIPALERRMGALEPVLPWNGFVLAAGDAEKGGLEKWYGNPAEAVFHVWAGGAEDLAQAIARRGGQWIGEFVRLGPGLGVENRNDSFENAFRQSLARLVLESAGFEAAARQGRAEVLAAGERGGRMQVAAGRVEALLQEILKACPDFVERMFRVKRAMMEQGRIRTALDIHQTAMLFSYALEQDAFPLFRRHGFPAEHEKARFGRATVDIRTLESVIGAGKTAITGTKYNAFVLKDGDGRSPDVVLELIGCPAGIGLMGRGIGGFGPVWRHPVAVSEDFYLGRVPVTKRQWATVMGDRKRTQQEFLLAKALGGGDTAADHLSRAEVLAFCAKLTERFHYRLPPGYVFRPPTELEWEYACRAGDAPGVYAEAGPLSEEDERLHCWTQANSLALVRKNRVKLPDDFNPANLPCGPVGKRRANAWGFQDMFGLGWEICLDTFAPVAGRSRAEMTSPEGLAKAFAYEQLMRNNQDFYFRHDGPGAYVCLRGMDYLGPDSLTKTLVPVDAEPLAEMTFRVCLGPDLAGEKPGPVRKHRR